MKYMYSTNMYTITYFQAWSIGFLRKMGPYFWVSISGGRSLNSPHESSALTLGNVVKPLVPGLR